MLVQLTCKSVRVEAGFGVYLKLKSVLEFAGTIKHTNLLVVGSNCK